MVSDMQLNERIPTTSASSNKRLLRALEHWQPAYLDWWRDMGPQGFQDQHQVYLRTAISVDAAGWAHFDYVKPPDYRWGIFLAEPTPIDASALATSRARCGRRCPASSATRSAG